MTVTAFLSYSTVDRVAAGALKQHLERASIGTFMAHDDIQVSEEWRIRLLKELRANGLFICLLSRNYLSSVWCIQESGVAAFRRGVVVVPLSLDGTLAPGFLANVHTIPFDPESIQLSDLGAAIVRLDFKVGIDFLIEELRGSRDFRAGEANMRALLPLVPKMDDIQIASVLSVSANTYRVISANLCVRDYLPHLVQNYGHLASPETLSTLRKACRM